MCAHSPCSSILWGTRAWVLRSHCFPGLPLGAYNLQFFMYLFLTLSLSLPLRNILSFRTWIKVVPWKNAKSEFKSWVFLSAKPDLKPQTHDFWLLVLDCVIWSAPLARPFPCKDLFGNGPSSTEWGWWWAEGWKGEAREREKGRPSVSLHVCLVFLSSCGTRIRSLYLEVAGK